MKRYKTALWSALLAITAIAGIGLEYVLRMITEIMIYGAEMGAWSVPQNILYRLAICVIWGAISALLIYLAKEECDFDIFKSGKKMTATQWMIIGEIIVGSLIVSCMSWNGSKVIYEFISNGWIKFIFQYIFYLFEMVLVTLVLVFGQRAFEQLFRQRMIPYGGILIALAWGAYRFVTEGALQGVVSVIMGMAFGCVYLLVNRDIRKAYPILFVMFAV